MVRLYGLEGLGFSMEGLALGHMKFPRMRGTILGGPNNKDYSIFGVCIGVPLSLGKYHIATRSVVSSAVIRSSQTWVAMLR